MHVVMNIVLFFAMWIEQCVGQVYIVCVPLENQSYIVCTMDQSMDQSMGHVKDQSYGDMMHVTKNLMYVQRTNPMGRYV